jgi:hypothetical protein
MKIKKNQARTCGRCGQKFTQDRLKYVKKDFSPTRYLCFDCHDIVRGMKPKNWTDKEEDLLDEALETVKQKYLEQGGKAEEMESDDYIDYFFCNMIYYQGKAAVRNFLKNYIYNPRQKKQPVYAEN